MRAAAGRLDGPDLVEDLPIAAGQEGSAVDHHVDLVGARRHGELHVGEFHRERRAAGRKGRRHRGDPDAGAFHGAHRGGGHVGVDADRRDLRSVGAVRIGTAGLGAERPDLAFGVGAFQGGQVDHRDRGVDRPALGGLLDAPGREAGGPLIQPDLVDAGQTVQEPAQRPVVPDGIGELGRSRRLCHARSLSAEPR